MSQLLCYSKSTKLEGADVYVAADCIVVQLVISDDCLLYASSLSRYHCMLHTTQTQATTLYNCAPHRRRDSSNVLLCGTDHKHKPCYWVLLKTIRRINRPKYVGAYQKWNCKAQKTQDTVRPPRELSGMENEMWSEWVDLFVLWCRIVQVVRRRRNDRGIEREQYHSLSAPLISHISCRV